MALIAISLTNLVIFYKYFSRRVLSGIKEGEEHGMERGRGMEHTPSSHVTAIFLGFESLMGSYEGVYFEKVIV